MSFQVKYLMVSAVSIVLIVSCVWIIRIETEEKIKETEEVAAGPRGDILFRNLCSNCHQFDDTSHTPLNLGNVKERMDAEALASFIQLPPPPMPEWQGSLRELDALVEYLIAGPSPDDENWNGEQAAE